MLDLIVSSAAWFWAALICCVKLFCCAWFKLDAPCNVVNAGCLSNVKPWRAVFNWSLAWFASATLSLIFWTVGLPFNTWLISVNFWRAACNFWLYAFNEAVVIPVVSVGWLMLCSNCVFAFWSGALSGVNAWRAWSKSDFAWFAADVFVLIWSTVGEPANTWLICWTLLRAAVNFALYAFIESCVIPVVLVCVSILCCSWFFAFSKGALSTVKPLRAWSSAVLAAFAAVTFWRIVATSGWDASTRSISWILVLAAESLSLNAATDALVIPVVLVGWSISFCNWVFAVCNGAKSGVNPAIACFKLLYFSSTFVFSAAICWSVASPLLITFCAFVVSVWPARLAFSYAWIDDCVIPSVVTDLLISSSSFVLAVLKALLSAKGTNWLIACVNRSLTRFTFVNADCTSCTVLIGFWMIALALFLALVKSLWSARIELL